MRPDENVFRNDLRTAEYLIGAIESRWGVVETSLLPSGIVWPTAIIWVATKAKCERYFFRFDLADYPIQPPTGSFCDPESGEYLALDKRPKTKGRGELVFRTDWQGRVALYHPYDRVAAQSHSGWATQYPNLVWGRGHTITDLLEELFHFLNEELET